MALQLDDQPHDNRAMITLQPTEQSLLDAASRIFAARIVAGKCTSENEKDEMRYAVGKAIQMAAMIDKAVRADNER